MAKQMKRVMVVGCSGSGKTTFIYKIKLGDMIDETYMLVMNSNRILSSGAAFKQNTQFLEISSLNDYHNNPKKQEYMKSASAFVLFIDSTDTESLYNGKTKKYLDILCDIARKKSNSNKGWLDNIMNKDNNDSKSNSLTKPCFQKTDIYSKCESQDVPPLLIYINKQDLVGGMPDISPYNTHVNNGNYPIINAKNIKQIGVDLGLYEWMDYKPILKASEGMLLYNCSDDIIDVIIEYMNDKDIVSVDEKKAMFHLEGCCATTGDGLYEGLDWLYRKMK